MNKSDLIEKVAAALESKKQAQTAVDSILDAITEALKNKEKISLIGFGTFEVTERKARKGRNPKTGEPIDIKAANVPKFTPGKALKEAVNG
ncbi:MAG: HU family DNA-binding protein [Desulfococcaceae bacterium]|nr:HU family DNA-binding protein [Desulfococcaceae bacterium]